MKTNKVHSNISFTENRIHKRLPPADESSDDYVMPDYKMVKIADGA